jgi:regulatory protein
VSDPARALELAYRYLGRRDRTVAEVRGHLEAKGCEAAAVDAAVAELSAAGYLDDARYAVRYAEDRRTLDGWGSERIAQRLAAAGVDRADIDAALATRDHAAELDAAVALLRRRFPALDSDRERDRALGLLVRRGYELDLAYDAVRAAAP